MLVKLTTAVTFCHKFVYPPTHLTMDVIYGHPLFQNCSRLILPSIALMLKMKLFSYSHLFPNLIKLFSFWFFKCLLFVFLEWQKSSINLNFKYSNSKLMKKDVVFDTDVGCDFLHVSLTLRSCVLKIFRNINYRCVASLQFGL